MTGNGVRSPRPHTAQQELDTDGVTTIRVSAKNNWSRPPARQERSVGGTPHHCLPEPLTGHPHKSNRPRSTHTLLDAHHQERECSPPQNHTRPETLIHTLRPGCCGTVPVGCAPAAVAVAVWAASRRRRAARAHVRRPGSSARMVAATRAGAASTADDFQARANAGRVLYCAGCGAYSSARVRCGCCGRARRSVRRSSWNAERPGDRAGGWRGRRAVGRGGCGCG